MALRIVPTLSGDEVTTHSYDIIFPIDEVDFVFFFHFNERMGRWVLDITAPTGEAVVTGAVVVQEVDLFSYADIVLRPRGFLLCTWKSDEPSAEEPGELDLGTSSQLMYFERVEDLFDTPATELPPA
jgi:hypothetical protein